MSLYTCDEIHEKLSALAPIDSVSFGSWTDKSAWSIQFKNSATDSEKAAAQAVLDAIDLSKTPLAATHRTCSPFEFYRRFTADELAALTASTDAQVLKWEKNMEFYQVCVLDGEEMETAMAYLVSTGLISETRKTEILA